MIERRILYVQPPLVDIVNRFWHGAYDVRPDPTLMNATPCAFVDGLATAARIGGQKIPVG